MCLQKGEADALRKVRLLSWTGISSFVFSAVKWVVSGEDYGCGFGVWPSFGFKALGYTWNFDWQQNYIGAGVQSYLGRDSMAGQPRAPAVVA